MARTNPTPQPGVKREQIQVKIRPVLRQRLEREAEARLINKNFIVERALEELFKKFDDEPF